MKVVTQNGIAWKILETALAKRYATLEVDVGDGTIIKSNITRAALLSITLRGPRLLCLKPL